MTRRHLVWLLPFLFVTMGASFRTQNFYVQAPTPKIAQLVGQWAEYYRKEKAKHWLGHEMPNWPQPCPLQVQVTMSGPGGATTFQFGQNRVISQRMEIQGPLDRLIASVLPHEVTHTVFAHYFRTPVPRWADEGGSVLSEDDLERKRHDQLTRSILRQSRQIPLRRLFSLREYPRDVMCLYAQGFSMADYLVKRTDRKTFLRFVGHGMHYGWDSAIRTYYGHRSVEELEQAWLRYLQDYNYENSIEVASNNRKQPANTTNVANRNTIVRLTAPPIQPLRPEPVFRGQSPDSAAGWTRRPTATPTRLPEFSQTGGGEWQPTSPRIGYQSSNPQQNPVPVQLLPPRYVTP